MQPVHPPLSHLISNARPLPLLPPQEAWAAGALRRQAAGPGSAHDAAQVGARHSSGLLLLAGLVLRLGLSFLAQPAASCCGAGHLRRASQRSSTGSELRPPSTPLPRSACVTTLSATQAIGCSAAGGRCLLCMRQRHRSRLSCPTRAQPAAGINVTAISAALSMAVLLPATALSERSIVRMQHLQRALLGLAGGCTEELGGTVRIRFVRGRLRRRPAWCGTAPAGGWTAAPWRCP